ncbi:alpha/beta hydrolase [Saccharospirillum alexandrii]|uniref:alpha/beta hydrolase n=1 Tax=Saccharospirillum alexandrii TaxID=2448477 RepID=UPI000FD8D130|nr:alpha/beta fold hydrolase [Saccharospirillum alexandrii]
MTLRPELSHPAEPHSPPANIVLQHAEPGRVPASYRALAAGLNLIGRVSPTLSARVLQTLWFRPVHGRPGQRTQAFWQSAERRHCLITDIDGIDLHFWGNPDAPLILGVHGWRGTGAQFRHLVPGLVEEGYQVCLFDMPAHGMNRTRFTHVFEFMQVLLSIQGQLGRPAGVIAHSLGCQAVVQAVSQGFEPGHLAFIAPGINMDAILDRFCQSLGLSSNVHKRFKTRLGTQSIPLSQAWIGTRETLYERLSHQVARQYLNHPGLLIADDQDEEIRWQDFQSITGYWPQAETSFSSGLGHYRILKDEAVVHRVAAYFGRQL